MVNTQHRALEPRDSWEGSRKNWSRLLGMLGIKDKLCLFCFFFFLALALGRIRQSSSISMTGTPIQRNGFWETRHRRNRYNRMEIVVSAGISCHSLKQKTLWFTDAGGLWTVVFRLLMVLWRGSLHCCSCPPHFPRLNKGRTSREEVTLEGSLFLLLS